MFICFLMIRRDRFKTVAICQTLRLTTFSVSTNNQHTRQTAYDINTSDSINDFRLGTNAES
jgi:hypothetical protein